MKIRFDKQIAAYAQRTRAEVVDCVLDGTESWPH